MNDHVEQAIFIRAALLETEAAAQALPASPERRRLIAAQRRLHARLYAGLILLEAEHPGITAWAVPDSGGGDKNSDFAPAVGSQLRQAA